MANSLKKVINKEGISMAELARLSGLSNTTIVNICNHTGTSNIREATKSKIVKAINKYIGEEKYAVEDIF